MRRSLRTMKRKMRRTPGGRLITVFGRQKPSYAHCGGCGAKLVRKRLRAVKVGRLAKSSRRPERPYPELCSRCMRTNIKRMLR